MFDFVLFRNRPTECHRGPTHHSKTRQNIETLAKKALKQIRRDFRLLLPLEVALEFLQCAQFTICVNDITPFGQFWGREPQGELWQWIFADVSCDVRALPDGKESQLLSPCPPCEKWPDSALNKECRRLCD
jgi:hypothetical protein